jgi:hypothetical protein
MRLSFIVLVAVASVCMAVEWAVDTTCGELWQEHGCFNAYMTLLEDMLVPDSRDRIIEAVQEGFSIAENAFDVMTNDGQDFKVIEMCKLILGDDNFQAKFEQARCKSCQD